MLPRPMHTCTFQARLHHQLVATFHRPTTDGPVLGLKVWILHLRLALLEIIEVPCQIRQLWMELH